MRDQRRRALWLAVLVALQLIRSLESAGGDAEGVSGELAWLHRPRPSVLRLLPPGMVPLDRLTNARDRCWRGAADALDHLRDKAAGGVRRAA